jgi:hypothetical protein
MRDDIRVVYEIHLEFRLARRGCQQQLRFDQRRSDPGLFNAFTQVH